MGTPQFISMGGSCTETLTMHRVWLSLMDTWWPPKDMTIPTALQSPIEKTCRLRNGSDTITQYALFSALESTLWFRKMEVGTIYVRNQDGKKGPTVTELCELQHAPLRAISVLRELPSAAPLSSDLAFCALKNNNHHSALGSIGKLRWQNLPTSGLFVEVRSRGHYYDNSWTIQPSNPQNRASKLRARVTTVMIGIMVGNVRK